MLYSALRPLLFRLDPELTHESAMSLLAAVDRAMPPARALSASGLGQRLFGVDFPNPLGLAAGFDKNGRFPHLWAHFGFGFAELGTITARAQPGNPKPRLFRLPAQRALINRLGFNNRGAEAVAAHLRNALSKPAPTPIGINLGKSKVTPLDEAGDDYRRSYTLLAPLADYVTINVSSPNTPGLRSLQTIDNLATIVDAVRSVELAEHPPLLVKLAPDLADEDLADLAGFAVERKIDGLIATNTTLAREAVPAGTPHRDEGGGLSGAPLRARSTEVIARLYQHCDGAVPIVGVGGISDASHAADKILAGANLLQMYTGFVYGGPSAPRDLVSALPQHLEKAGFGSISEAVGARAG